jgi:hypothetical protein
MSDDETRPIDPEAPVPPPAAEQQQPGPDPGQPYAGHAYAGHAYAGQPYPSQPYAMPVPPGYPPYAAQQRPRFADQVLGMRAVVATALACLIIGGLSGFILGRASSHEQDVIVRPGFGNLQRGAFPNGPNAFPRGSNNNQGPNGG